jgi:hypothetical protein
VLQDTTRSVRDLLSGSLSRQLRQLLQQQANAHSAWAHELSQQAMTTSAQDQSEQLASAAVSTADQQPEHAQACAADATADP